MYWCYFLHSTILHPKVTSTNVNYVSYIHYAATHLKPTFFTSTLQRVSKQHTTFRAKQSTFAVRQRFCCVNHFITLLSPVIFVKGTCGGMEVQLDSFLTSTFERRGRLHAPTGLPQGKYLRDTWNKRLGGPQNRSGCSELGKIPCLCRVSNHTSSVVQVVARSHHRLNHFTFLNIKTWGVYLVVQFLRFTKAA
jgi:hypothetical protein